MNTINKNFIPQDGLAGLKENFGKDLLSGFMVSLLALPLSLGIAKASDFPNPMYGVLTAIIGGVVVSFLAGSQLTIKGPAAGLIVIVSGSIAEFGGGEHGWQLTLGVIVVAAVVQFLFGLFKLGKLSDFFPLSAVHGMLAAIGLIIIAKQLYVLLGLSTSGPDGHPITSPFGLLGNLPFAISHASNNMPIVIVGATALAIVLLLPMVKNPIIKKIPAPMVVLLVVIPLGVYLNLKDIKGGVLKFDKSFVEIVGFNASFEGVKNIGVFVKYVILFAIIGSLESLLTVKAIDMLDPFRRKSDYNKDIIAVGLGNGIAALLGGIPMISEVARSSANVNNGARTRWANFFHGACLLMFMLFLMPVIQMIPNAALAALLIGVGIKLAHPKEFIHALHIGKEQFLIFVVTIFFTLFEDLLVGIAAGIVTELIVNIINGRTFAAMFKAPTTVEESEFNEYYVNINDAAVFSNFLGIKNKLYNLPKEKNVTINLSNTKLIDHSAMEGLHLFKHDYEESGGKVVVVGLDNHTPFSNHEFAARKQS
ncbi:SulP family inorganic anion transporter [Flectobacillus major]|jgi:MFS superfamily sulfate permease-like transporter|uniref:SulP family inorganic anion transporter n=1 Tax=Flectobacillus major TaxID=103 RepID=UPI000412E9A0|nr:SulP family inorganic anion transporter [Flectobacillus major]